MSRRIGKGSTSIVVVSVAALGLLLGVTDVPAQTRLPGVDLRARVGLGHDTNSFREAATGDAGYYLPYDLRARYERAPGKNSTLRFTAKASGEEYVGAVSDGGRRDFDLDVDWFQGLLGHPRRSHHSTLELEAHGDFAINRRIYISRADGEEYTVDFQGAPIPLGGRYNSKDLQAATGIRLQWPQGTEWSALYDVRHRDYDEDYTDITAVDRLDNRRSRVRFGVQQRIGRPVELRTEYAYEITDYYDRSVHDLLGDRVEGVAQTFYRNRLSAAVHWKPISPFRAVVETGWVTRRDPYLGYYDSQEWSFEPRVQVQATKRLELRIAYGYQHRSYDRARVAFDPLQPLREDHDQEFSFETSYELKTGSAVFFVVEHDANDDMNPLYSYARTRSWAGYELRY